MRDKEIREVLLQQLRKRYCNDSNTLIVEEFGLCQGDARIDIAVINGAMYGFEIKSERDTLRRLPGQRNFYNEVFDYVTIVADAHHLQSIRKVVPEWWGLNEAQNSNGKIKLLKRRGGEKNKEVAPEALVQLLWRDEVFEILKRRHIHQGLSGKPRRLLWARLSESLSLAELSKEVRTILRNRQNWRSGKKQE